MGLGHELGPIPKRGPRGPWGPARAGLGPGKKPGTLNGPGLGHGPCLAGRVRVWKNPARTRPVAIPSWLVAIVLCSCFIIILMNSLYYLNEMVKKIKVLI